MKRAPGPADLVRPEILSTAGYHVPDAAGLIKLDAMENPHPLPASLQASWARELAGIPINRYPDPGARALKAALRAYYGIDPGLGLMVGNGSDEILQMLTLALARPGASVLALEPSFVMYRRCTELAGMGYAGVALGRDFALCEAELLDRIAQCRPALVFIAQPNNPTGNLFDPAALERIAGATPGLLVIDEAYHAFSGADSLPLAARHDNVLVMRTLSKLGLAGLRIGWLAGARQWMDEIEKVRMPYNVGVLAQAAGVFMLAHRDVFAAQAAGIRAEREHLYEALAGRPRVQVWPSAANFLLFRVTGRPGPGVQAGLRGHGVLIKSLDGAHPLLADCLRVTVGTARENAAFLAALDAELGADP